MAAGSHRGGLSDPHASISRRSVGAESRLRSSSHPCPLRSTSTARPWDCVRQPAAARVPCSSEEDSLARRGQSQTGARHTAPRKQRRVRAGDDLISVLARTVREVEAAVHRGPGTPALRTKFQVVALLVREEHARVRAEETSSDTRAEQLKRLDGIATILAKTAVRDPALLALLSEDAVVSEAARSLKRDLLRAVGIESEPEEPPPPPRAVTPFGSERGVVPQSVVSRQLANPFLAPDFSSAPQRPARPRRLAGWELLGPLLSSFERAGGGASACMALPAPG